MKTENYDVVIVGTGVAGCFAALHLPRTSRILMITKADLEDSDSFLAQGGICVLKDESDFAAYMEDTLKAGHYKNSREAVEVMIRSSQEVIRELQDFGVRFHQENGQLSYTREGAHSTNRILFHDDITGREITSVLLHQVQQLANVTIKTRTTMLDLLTRDNRCYGLIAQAAGELRTYLGRDVILACGGLGGICENSTNFPHLTGDGCALALKRGVELKDVDYIQIHPTTLYSREKGKRFLISESVRGEGALLYNKNMERFVNELLPRDKVAQAIFRQMEADERPFVWLSMMSIQGLDIAKRFPNIFKKCQEEGYDPRTECIPVVPAQHYLMGGIKTDTKGRTSMGHLYAVGETSNNGVHGANRLASNSLLESLVFAKRAALHILHHPGHVYDGETDADACARAFALDYGEYADPAAYAAKLKERLWQEIESERQEEKKVESDNEEIKCG